MKKSVKTIIDLIPAEFKNQRVLCTEQLATLYNVPVKYIQNNFHYAKEHFEEGVHYFCLKGDELREFKKQLREATFKGIEHVLINCPAGLGHIITGNNLQGQSGNGAPKASVCMDYDNETRLEVPLTIGKNAAQLYLWTVQGVARHCKMINNQIAWNVFGLLENAYFHPTVPVEKTAADTADLAAEIAELKEQVEKLSGVFDFVVQGLQERTLTRRDKADRLIEIARLMEPSPARERILIRAANILSPSTVNPKCQPPCAKSPV